MSAWILRPTIPSPPLPSPTQPLALLTWYTYWNLQLQNGSRSGYTHKNLLNSWVFARIKHLDSFVPHIPLYWRHHSPALQRTECLLLPKHYSVLESGTSQTLLCCSIVTIEQKKKQHYRCVVVVTLYSINLMFVCCVLLFASAFYIHIYTSKWGFDSII